MDTTAMVDELEALVRMVAVAARKKYAYSAELEVQRRISEWRQATYQALKDAHKVGYDTGYDMAADEEMLDDLARQSFDESIRERDE